jgi:hypothetical protein
MSKFFAAVCVFGLLLFGNALSQTGPTWKFAKAFPDAGFKGNMGCHGLAVDPSGKVWIQISGESDSVVTASGQKLPTRVIYIFNRDGSPAPFSPIKTITVAGITDSMQTPPGWSNRGLRADHQGNILACSFDRLFRINYATGAGMNKVIPQPEVALTAPAVDAQGNIYTAQVDPNAYPIRIYDTNFTLADTAVDRSPGLSRSFEIEKDGRTIYWAGYSNHAVYRYTRPTDTSLFAQPDTILKGMDAESFAWQPKTGYLWLSAGNYNDRPNRFPGANTSWSPNTWYAYNPQTGQVVDSLKWIFNTPGNVNERPRAIAFSVSGDTAYVGCFGGNDYPAVQMFVKTTTGVAEKDRRSIPESYSLSQNYPNPFNPVTEIKFALGGAGLTTVKIYNVLGAEVATLVNANLPAGDHRVKFDTATLPSGTYIYEMHSNSVRLTKKLTVIK